MPKTKALKKRNEKKNHYENLPNWSFMLFQLFSFAFLLLTHLNVKAIFTGKALFCPKPCTLLNKVMAWDVANVWKVINRFACAKRKEGNFIIRTDKQNFENLFMRFSTWMNKKWQEVEKNCARISSSVNRETSND